MKSKVFYLVLQVVLLGFCILPVKGFTCGTIEGWVENYFETTSSGHQRALSMIHCGPIPLEHYQGTPEQHELLAKMIDSALRSEDQCNRDLALKNFFIYDQLYLLEHTEIHNKIIDEIEPVIQKPVIEVEGFLSFYNFENSSRYCNKVHGEISYLTTGIYDGPGRPRGKDIAYEKIEEKSNSIESFVDKTNECFSGELQPLEEKVLRVFAGDSYSLNYLFLKDQPGNSGEDLTELKRGDYLRTINTANEWLEVVTEDCQVGWVRESHTKEVKIHN